MKISVFIPLLFCVGLVSFACTKGPKFNPSPSNRNGSDSPGSDDDEDSADAVADASGDTFALQCSDAGPKGLRSIRKLSNIEIINTVADVFGVSSGLDSSEFSEDIQKSAGGFDNAMTEANFVDDRRLGGYIKFAESLAAQVDLTKLFPCLAQGDSCFKTSLPGIAALAWRRPATQEEIANLLSFASKLTGDGSKPEEVANSLVVAIATSHGFLYRSEMGVKNTKGDYELTDWEVASALSYFITRHPPDAILRGLAEKGSLKSAAVIKVQAERLFATAAAKSAWADFADMWLVASAVKSHSPKVTEFTDAVKDAAVKETKDYFVNTLFDDKAGSFEQLLTSEYTYASDGLQWIYKGTASSGKVNFLEPQRRGLLGQVGFLASHASETSSSPVTRGAFVMKKLLCSDFVGAPPSSPISGAAANIDGRKLRKENTACSSCHDTIDSVGFTFENFDQVGRFRDKDEMGEAIVASNTLSIDGKDVSYDGPAELAKAIADSSQGLECMSRQMFRFGMGRMERAKIYTVGVTKPFVASKESNADACYISGITAAMKDKNGNLKSGVIALVTSPGFLVRQAVKTAP